MDQPEPPPFQQYEPYRESPYPQRHYIPAQLATTPKRKKRRWIAPIALVIVLACAFWALEWQDVRSALPPSPEQQALDDVLAKGLSGQYAYEQLDEQDQEKYRIMLRAFQDREKLAYPNYDMQDAARIEEHVKADHPELEDYVQFCLWEGGLLTPAYISGFYYLDEQSQQALESQLDAALGQCAAEVSRQAGSNSNYALAKSAYEWIALNTEYDAQAAAASGAMDIRESTTEPGVIAADSRVPRDYGQTVANVLVDRKAVCAGYARAYQLILQELGITCAYVKGTVEGQAHAWCLAELDGDYYLIDPTWGDPQYAADESSEVFGGIDYNFFCVTSADMLQTHVADSAFPLPDCTAIADNYYVHEGRYFDQADIERLGALMSGAMQDGTSEALVVRCANQMVYDSLLHDCLETGELARFTPNGSYRFGATTQPFYLLAVTAT